MNKYIIIDDLKQQRQTNEDMIIYNKKMIEKEKRILSDSEKFFINEKNNIEWRSFDYHTLQGWQHKKGYYYKKDNIPVEVIENNIDEARNRINMYRKEIISLTDNTKWINSLEQNNWQNLNKEMGL
jgi:hypothetical protein